MTSRNTTSRSQKLAARKQQAERSRQVSAACADEIARVNASLASGGRATITTHSGVYVMVSVSADFWYSTCREGGYSHNPQAWCGCNDEQWADIMRQLNLPRHPLFA